MAVNVEVYIRAADRMDTAYLRFRDRVIRGERPDIDEFHKELDRIKAEAVSEWLEECNVCLRQAGW
jgi:uncharacterized Fe-S radical SAM superfamily protein PflX